MKTGVQRESLTGFAECFTEAEKYGAEEVEKMFDYLFRDWKNHDRHLNELVTALVDKVTSWTGKNEELCSCYLRLYKKAHDYMTETETWGVIMERYKTKEYLSSRYK